MLMYIAPESEKDTERVIVDALSLACTKPLADP
jgi:hypothetical protein